jgi:hypothetical protein
MFISKHKFFSTNNPKTRNQPFQTLNLKKS